MVCVGAPHNGKFHHNATMKKTLFAMLAVALLGGQVFGATEVKLSDYEGESFTSDILTTDSNIIVDTSEKSGGGKFEGGNHTFIFDGDNVWTPNKIIDIKDITVDISATQSATQNWIDALTSGDLVGVKLFGTTRYTYLYHVGLADLTFMGVSKGDTITLTGTTDTLTATYKGLKFEEGLKDGEVGLVEVPNWTTFQKDYYLYGKGLTKSPIVPEPATATLSLLALAGLATRRRRK